MNNLRIWKYLEQLHPYAIGLILAVIAAPNVAELVVWAKANDIDIKGFFTAIFGFSSITTAFLLTSFTLAMAPGGGFIERIFPTKTFRLFMRYMAEAIGFGFILSATSIIFMVYEIKVVGYFIEVAFCLWILVFVGATLDFCRVTYIFIIWIRASSSRRSLNLSPPAS